MPTETIGKGTPSFPFAATRGRLQRFDTPADVIASLDSDLEQTIALVESGGTTFLSPILGRLGGIICRSGTLRSHLAIVSREYEVPCLIATELSEIPDNGVEVAMEARGSDSGVVSLV